MSQDYCELCDLPLSTCVHGMPAAPRPAAVPPAVKVSRPGSSSGSQRAAKAPRTPKPAKVEVPVRRAPRRWNAPDFFAPHVIAVLQDAGGALDTESLFEALEARVEPDLIPGDRERTPEGELRWRRAARVARRDLAADGLMLTGTPGSWALTAAGLAHDPGAW